MKRSRELCFVAGFLLCFFLINFSDAQKCFKVFNVNRQTKTCNQLIKKDINFEDCCLKFKGAGYSKGRSRRNCQPCQETAGWDMWGSWSECSVSCGSGIQSRVRRCPSHVKCSGNKDEFKPCHLPPCKVDGGWSEWSAWSDCSVSCGTGGYQRSSRRCSNPRPAHGGKRCKGKLEKFKKCKNIPVHCPIDGQWGNWGRWTVCVGDVNSTSCLGTQTRIRQCNNPPPQYGGIDCPDLISASEDLSVCKMTTGDCEEEGTGGSASGSASGESFFDPEDDTEGDDYVLDEPH